MLRHDLLFPQIGKYLSYQSRKMSEYISGLALDSWILVLVHYCWSSSITAGEAEVNSGQHFLTLEIYFVIRDETSHKGSSTQTVRSTLGCFGEGHPDSQVLIHSTEAVI